MNEKSKKREKTIGKLLQETHEEHLKQRVQLGELSWEVGNKELMAEIQKQIDEREGLPQWKEKYYLLCLCKKNSVFDRVVEIYVQSRHTRPQPEPNLILFSYDPKTKELFLEWIVPQKQAFPFFRQLQGRGEADPFLIKCMDLYEKGKLT